MNTPKDHSYVALTTALVATIEAVRRRDPDVLPSMRRIARQIRDVAVTAGQSAAARFARRLELAETEADAQIIALDLLAAVRATEDTGDGGRYVILMVEDDRLTVEVMRDALRADHHEVIVARTAEEARMILDATHVSLILLDLVLPDADGRDLLAQMRAQPELRDVPVIVMTARSDAIAQTECFALGADGYLAKPIRPDLLMTAVSSRLAAARRMLNESRVDALTGLPNRVAFGEALQRTLTLSRRNHQPLTIAMIDLDRFKSINDAYGHATGDHVLRTAGAIFTSTLRTSDFVARWGGEEFCVFFPNTDVDGAVVALNNVLEEMRGLVHNAPDDSTFHVTFSAGVARFDPANSIEDVVAEADRLLYVAKERGRNRIVSAQDVGELTRRPVLIADDDKAVANTVKIVLEREGFEVVMCANGAEALEVVHDRDFVLAIVDVNMPVMDGFELLRALRAQPKTAKLPVMMLTGSGAEADIMRGFELGVNDYVLKPFYNSELIARAKRLLNAH